MKFTLPEKYYQPAEDVCKKGYVFLSTELTLDLPEIYNSKGIKSKNLEYRIVYSPEKRLFTLEEILRKSAGGFHYEEILSTGDAEVVDNCIKYMEVINVVSEDAGSWIGESLGYDEPWENILFDLMKNVDLTENDCKYLKIDPERAKRLRKSSDLGLI